MKVYMPVNMEVELSPSPANGFERLDSCIRAAEESSKSGKTLYLQGRGFTERFQVEGGEVTVSKLPRLDECRVVEPSEVNSLFPVK